MSTNYQFFSDASVKKEVKDELEKLKQFSHHDFPFRVQDMIESTLAVAGDCMQILNYCCDLLEELHRLETYKKQKNKTRIMLLLSRYGSEKSLLNKANSEIATLGRRLQDFDDYVKKIQPNMIEAKGFVCTKCNGRGTVLERTYIRERGSFPQAILKSTPCKTCDGNGIIDFDPEIKEELSKFDSQAVKVLQIFEKHYENVSKYVNDYTPISFEELERTEVRSVSSREELVPVKKTFQQPMKMYYQTIKKKASWKYPKEYFLILLHLKRKPSRYSSRASDGTPTWWERRAKKPYLCSICKKYINRTEIYIGRRKLKPGIRGIYGHKGTYKTSHFHIICLLKKVKSTSLQKVTNLESAINRQKNEKKLLEQDIKIKEEQISKILNEIERLNVEYDNSNFLLKIGKWISYKSKLKSNNLKKSSLEEEITRLQYILIPQLDKQIFNQVKEKASLISEISKIKKEIRKLEGRTLPEITQSESNKPYIPADKRKEVKRDTIRRSRKGEVTPHGHYRLPILESLIEMEGSGRMQKVLDRVFYKVKNDLKPKDLDRLPSGRSIRWRNAVQWERLRLIKEGYLKNDSMREIWEITDKGRELYEKMKRASRNQ